MMEARSAASGRARYSSSLSSRSGGPVHTAHHLWLNDVELFASGFASGTFQAPRHPGPSSF